MQSFLQHRRFGQRLKQQYERHRGHLRDLAGGDQTESQPSSSGSQSPAADQGDSSLARKSQEAERRDLNDDESGNRPPQGSRADSQDAATLTVNGDAADVATPFQEFSDALEKQPSRHQGTLRAMGSTLGKVITGVREHKDDKGKDGSDRKLYIVDYQGDDDDQNPQNWSHISRWTYTIVVALIGFLVGFASSIDSSALKITSAEFGVSEVTESLATGLFLIGFGVGGFIAGPFSEEFGRNPVYIATLILFMIFEMAAALAPNIGGQLVFRFFGGLFASTPLTCAGGSISDMWNAEERAYTFPIFANAAFLGPVMGPVVGGFIVQSYLDWRWVDWVTLIFAAGVLAITVLFLPETHSPTLLRWKAAHLRKLTGDDRFVAQPQSESFGRRVVHALYRPFLILIYEPIVVLFSLYLTVLYIILFTFLNGFTYIFAETYGLSDGLTGLCFLGIIVGLFLANLCIPYVRRRYLNASQEARRKAEETGDSTACKVPPENRLWFAMLGAPAVPLSLFWMGWTARPDISIWSPLAATVLFGYGTLCIFVSSYQYIIDSYEVYAASGLACVTITRYVAAGVMVEVAVPMYGNLGVDWTCTLLGCLSALMTLVPYLLYVYGPKIRKLSKYTAR